MLLAVCVAAPADAQVVLGRLGGTTVNTSGLVQADAAWYRSDGVALSGNPRSPDGPNHDLRVAILFLNGLGPGGFDWRVGYERNTAKWLDMNARYRFGRERRSFLRAGQFKQPSGLERLSSLTAREFMSTAMMTKTFTLGNRLGVAYGHEFRYGEADVAGSHPTLALTATYFDHELAATRRIPNYARGNGVALRAAWAPVNQAGRIAHLGLSWADYDTRDAEMRWRVQPNMELTPVRLLDTGAMPAIDHVSVLGAEAFWVAGNVKLQGEYMLADAHRHVPADTHFQGAGGYVSALWNPGGETWRYVDGLPVTPVGAVTNAGMWQLGLRYDAIDLDDGLVLGGRMRTWTLGVNWYWNAHLKFVLNYVAVQSRRAAVTDDPAITGVRVQFHW
jgi:phosphate-selective porin OprO/OprP